jgi:hypothetical protein
MKRHTECREWGVGRLVYLGAAASVMVSGHHSNKQAGSVDKASDFFLGDVRLESPNYPEYLHGFS